MSVSPFPIRAALPPLCLAACLAFRPVAAAAEPPPAEASPFSIAVTPSHQFDASFDKGGSVHVSRYLVELRANKGLSETLGVGLNVAYEFAQFGFSPPAAFSGVKPWGNVHHLECGASVAYDLTPAWSVYLAPSVQFSREEGAGWGRAMAYGGDAYLTRDITPALTLGLGVEGFDDLEETSFLPLVIVNWKITDRLLLANPSHPGPVGQTGLELAYRLDGWEVATGASDLSNRFRLDSTGPFGNGVAETTSIPAWGRISRSVGPGELNVYAGAMLGGKMSIDDRGGSEIASDSYAPAPFVALAISGRF